MKKLYTVSETAEKNGGPLPMSIAGIYKLCATGKIPAVNVGRRVFIPAWFLEKLYREGKC